MAPAFQLPKLPAAAAGLPAVHSVSTSGAGLGWIPTPPHPISALGPARVSMKLPRVGGRVKGDPAGAANEGRSPSSDPTVEATGFVASSNRRIRLETAGICPQLTRAHASSAGHHGLLPKPPFVRKERVGVGEATASFGL